MCTVQQRWMPPMTLPKPAECSLYPIGPTAGLRDPGQTISDASYSTFRHRGRNLTQGGRSGFLTQGALRRERLASLQPAGARRVLYVPHRTHSGPENTTPRKKIYFPPLGDKFTLGTVFIAKRTVHGMRRRHPAHAARATPAKTCLRVPRNPAQSETIRTWDELLQAQKW
jgi:hypothetical protein